MLSLAGAHRSGKTTLAKILADKLGVDFLETKVGDVFADLGLDPKADMPFLDRLAVQNKILRNIEAQYELRRGQIFIADRSPFDVLGYTIADIQRGTVDPDHRPHVEAHLREGVRIVNTHLAAVMMLQPLQNAPDAEGKAQACPFYMDHVFWVIKGLIENVTPYLTNGMISVISQSYNLDERTQDGADFFGSIIKIMKPEPKIWTPNS